MSEFILTSKEIESIEVEACSKLDCLKQELEVYEGVQNCGTYGYPSTDPNMFSPQAFCKRTVLAFRKQGENVGLIYLNKYWKEWDGEFPLHY